MRDAFKTIVGGRFTESKSSSRFPRGIEVLIKKASVDQAFAEVFLRSPLEAAQLIALELKESEKTILINTPESTLVAIIKNTTVKRNQVSAFKTMSASLMLAAIIATSSLSCSTCSSGEGGILPHTTLPENELIEISVSRMEIIQKALEQYKSDNNGNYISTEQWYGVANPLLEYVEIEDTLDPYYLNLFHYEGIEEDGIVVNYRLESYGLDKKDSQDNIPCPIDTELHSW